MVSRRSSTAHQTDASKIVVPRACAAQDLAAPGLLRRGRVRLRQGHRMPASPPGDDEVRFTKVGDETGEHRRQSRDQVPAPTVRQQNLRFAAENTTDALWDAQYD